MKIQRTGYTETDLIFCKYLDEQCDLTDKLKHRLKTIQQKFINWLYTTSGWYDKTVNGSYFDIDYNDVISSDIYHKWTVEYTNAIKDSYFTTVLLHRFIFQPYIEYIEDFFRYLNINYNHKYNGYWDNSYKIYDLIQDKKILIISSFGGLIYQQVINKNIYKIYPNFPVIKNINYINFPYTFFNTGPDNNSFETLDNIMHQIEKLDFDIAIVGAGAYGAIITNRIHSNLHKDSITMCSGITKMFGICPSNQEKPYWITKIPDEYIPDNFLKIENGRYWVGKDTD